MRSRAEKAKWSESNILREAIVANGMGDRAIDLARLEGGVMKVIAISKLKCHTDKSHQNKNCPSSHYIVDDHHDIQKMATF
jgi:hypothetical protein